MSGEIKVNESKMQEDNEDGDNGGGGDDVDDKDVEVIDVKGDGDGDDDGDDDGGDGSGDSADDRRIANEEANSDECVRTVRDFDFIQNPSPKQMNIALLSPLLLPCIHVNS